MKTKSLIIAGILGTAMALTCPAAVLTFDTGQSNNQDLSLSFGSNLSADIAGANISNGATPNIGLAWAPSPDVWEVHGAVSFSPVGDGQVVQMDVDTSPADPTITFSVDAGWMFRLNSLEIGHATDQNEDAYAWTLTISEDGGPQVFSHTTALLGAGDTETVTFNFTGTTGTDYVLKFDDGGANTVRGAIDNLSFNQVVPEPSTLALLGAGGVMLMAVRRRYRS